MKDVRLTIKHEQGGWEFLSLPKGSAEFERMCRDLKEQGIRYLISEWVTDEVGFTWEGWR